MALILINKAKGHCKVQSFKTKLLKMKEGYFKFSFLATLLQFDKDPEYK